MTGLADVEAAPMLGPDGKPITARGWFDSEVDRARRVAGLYRPRARQPGAALRFQQGLYARAGRSGAAAAGGAQAAVQQGAGSAGDGAERPAAGGHADRDVRARARCRRQPDRLPGRRQDAGPVRDPPHRQFRHQRRGAAAVGRSVDPGAEIFLAFRHRHPHPPHSRSTRSRPAPWSTAPRSSRPISATRSTTWKASTPTSRRRATPC